MDGTQFYTSNDLTKYPNDGKLKQCKKCLTMHVNNWDPQTYLWILQEVDVPYIPKQWNQLLLDYTRDGRKITGMTILGRYLSKMKLNQYKEYRWKDTEYLQNIANKEIRETMQNNGYSAAEIDEAISKASVAIPEGVLEEPPPIKSNLDLSTLGVFDLDQYKPKDQFQDAETQEPPDDEPLYENDLTEEDIKYLKLKWGKSYKPDEWIWLEQLYNEMMESYDIQTAGHIDTLKLICKTSLKANQLIDIGDIEGYQKVSRVYDQLMKSGRFTAAQNKTEAGEFIDSISELVMICEKEGFIPRFYIAEPNDKVDETLQDMKNYTKTLITGELNLGDQIEGAVKEMAQIEAKEEDEDIDDDLDLDIIDEEEEEEEVTDEDHVDYKDFVEQEATDDDQLLLELLEKGDF